MAAPIAEKRGNTGAAEYVNKRSTLDRIGTGFAGVCFCVLEDRNRGWIYPNIKNSQRYAPLYTLVGAGHRGKSCRLTDRFFDISENRVQKLDSLGEELRDGSKDTFIMLQMRPKSLSLNRSANVRGKSYNTFPCGLYLPTGGSSRVFGLKTPRNLTTAKLTTIVMHGISQGR